VKTAGAVLTLFLSVALFGATEIPVVSDVVLHDAPGTRRAVALASDGDGYLAVWSDFRAVRPALIATRIRSTGEVLDPTGILLAPYDAQAAVVWNGERYLVFFAGDGALRLASIDPHGAVQGPRTLIEHVTEAAVATNGSRILVSYAGDAEALAQPRARVAALAMDGSLLLDMVVDLRRYGFVAPSVAVQPNGNFVAGWNLRTGSVWALNALRFDADGTRAEFVPSVLGDDFHPAALHANGDALVAASSFRCWAVSSDLRNVSAQARCPRGHVFSLHGRAALAFVDEPLGTRATLDMSLSVFDEQGHAVGQKQLFKATDVQDATVWTIAALQKGDDVLIAWTIDVPPGYEARLFARIISADSLEPKGEKVLLTKSADGQLDPAIAAGETEMLIAWEELRGIYASRITYEGRRLDGRGILLSTNHAHGPRVVFHDGRYAVAFVQAAGTEYQEVVVRFISPRDGLLPEIATTRSGDIEHIALASGGGTLLAVWADRRVLSATRVHPGGTTDPEVALVRKDDSYPTAPVAAWNGSHFLVAWVENTSGNRKKISGRRMTRDLGLEGDVLALADTEGGQDEEPALASNDSDWFLAWSQGNQVRLARIAADGTRLSDQPALHGRAPQLTFAGRQLVLAVKDFGNVTIQAGDSYTSLPSLPYDGFSVTSHTGRWYAAYTRLGGTETGHVERVYVASPGPRRRTVR